VGSCMRGGEKRARTRVEQKTKTISHGIDIYVKTNSFFWETRGGELFGTEEYALEQAAYKGNEDKTEVRETKKKCQQIT